MTHLVQKLGFSIGMPIASLIISENWTIKNIHTIGSAVNLHRNSAIIAGIAQVYTESKRNVTIVLPPARTVK